MSSLDQPHAGVLRFGVFEVDLAAHELRKRGVRIKLQEQPFRVLEALLDEPGQVVTRDDLRHRIWADDEFVEFDKSLNTCIQKIRRVLGDSATSPRFVETLPKLGYRFIAPVERTQGTEGLPPASARALGGIPTKSVLGAVAASFVAALAVTVLLPESQLPAPRFTSQPLTYEPGSEQHPSLSPDGTRVAYEADGGDPTKSRIYVRLTDVRAGAPIEVTSGPWLDKEPSWSPDGSRLVFVRILEVRPNHLGSRFKLLLASPTLHAPTQELTDREFLARNPGGILPIWSADAKHILFACKLDPSAAQTQICAHSLDTGETWALTKPPGSGVGDSKPALSPDGRKLVYQAANRPSELGMRVLSLTPALRPAGEPRSLPGARGSYRASWSKDGRTILLIGHNLKGPGGLWTMDLAAGTRPQLRWPIEIGRGGFWHGPEGLLRVAYVKQVEESELVRVDLRDPSRDTAEVLAPSSFGDFHPQYSPDGSKIAFISRRSGVAGIWLAEADGTNAYALVDMSRTAYFTAPMWSPDGTRIAADGFYYARNAHIVRIADREIGPALTERGGRMPTWNKDGNALWYYSHIGGKAGLWRLDLETQRHRKIRDVPGIMDIDESPDGRRLYYIQGFDLMASDLRGDEVGEPVAVASDVLSFALVDGAFYVRTRDDVILRFDEETGVRREIFRTDGRNDVPNLGITVSPDERWLIYVRCVRRETDLALLEGRL